MNNIIKLLGMAAVGVALSSAALAADTSSTINVRKTVTPLASSPQFAIVKATVTNVANGFTVDVPAPRGTANIVEIFPVVYASGTAAIKPAKITVSGRTITVSGSEATSGSLAVGDFLKALVIFNP